MSRFYGIYLIIALIAMSGAVAYVGDIVGRRMGRKRLSLFGMRPRHTAVAISVVSGMLITILTLSAAMALSLDVRLGFLRVGQMRAELRDLRGETKKLTAEHARLSDQTKSLTGDKQKLEQQLGQSRTALTKTERTLQQDQRRLTETEAKLKLEQISLLKAQEDARSATLAATRLGQQKTQLAKDVYDLNIIRRNSQRDLLREWLTPVVFSSRQPLDAILVDSRRPVPALRKQLDAFVAHLRAAVKEQGLKPPAGQDSVIIAHDFDPKKGWVPEDQVLEGLVDSIVKNPTPGGTIVQAFSVLNTHPDESLLVDFQMGRNQLAFPKGAKLGQITVPAGLPDWKVLESLFILLWEQVGPAGQGKVMPRSTLRSTRTITLSPNSVGTTSLQDLLAAIDEVKQLRGPARITAVAKDDTWTIGPLNVELRVEPAP